MFAASDPSIACLVLDSPFSSFDKLAKELVSGGADVRTHCSGTMA